MLNLLIILPPLIAFVIIGILGKLIGKKISHTIAILAILLATVMSFIACYNVYVNNNVVDQHLYTWLSLNARNYNISIFLDRISVVMLTIVTSVSLLVHIYSVAYMTDDEGYQRFFSYTTLFTFMMLMLVVADNFIQLFFAWEGVGLVSYLLIGFYFKKASANNASLKAFIINRIGDIGFILAIGLVFAYFGSLNYADLTLNAIALSGQKIPYLNTGVINTICFLFFVGAAAKSAQFPLHSWLPDSMEGPTPISALIHAATMVTAGVFIIARFSFFFDLAPQILSLLLYIGSINCLFLGILALVQTDIKRIIAYSTLSQLGYMFIALGCGAYNLAIFHLLTHAFFKSLLFLGAGSVILALHHQQDIRAMGNLAKYMKFTYISMLIGSLALAGIPPFAGFFSKDIILEVLSVAYKSHIAGSGFALFAAYGGVFVTACYIFRLFFVVFHGNGVKAAPNFTVAKVHESSLIIVLPLLILAIVSVVIGAILAPFFINRMALAFSVVDLAMSNQLLYQLSTQNVWQIILASFSQLPVYLALLGIVVAFVFSRYPICASILMTKLPVLAKLLRNNYYIDNIYDKIFVSFIRACANFFAKVTELGIKVVFIVLITKFINFSAVRLVHLQNGSINRYATLMIVGVIILLSFATPLIFN